MPAPVDEIWTSIGIDYPVSRDEIAAVARKMIEVHGKRAPHEAAERSRAALHNEDMDTYDLWLAIGSAITAILYPDFHERSFEEPKNQYSEADVWAAARQIMKLEPEYPSITAAQRADGLLGEGDMEGSAFWIRVTKALEDIERKAPRDGERIN